MFVQPHNFVTLEYEAGVSEWSEFAMAVLHGVDRDIGLAALAERAGDERRT